MHAALLNNQAAIDYMQGKNQSAYKRLQKALDLLPLNEADDARVLYMKMLGVVCDALGRTEEANETWQQAYQISMTIYGSDHPLTQELDSYRKK